MRKNQIYEGCVVKLKNDPNFYDVKIIYFKKNTYMINKLSSSGSIEYMLEHIENDIIPEDIVYIKIQDIEKFYTFSDYARLIQNENK